jgi:hypothetical protein
MKNFFFIFGTILINILFSNLVKAQEWEFESEKDGIAIYTREEAGSNFKAFKGEVEIQADFNMVCSLVEDVKRFDEWDEDVQEIRVIEHVENQLVRYYVVYDVPWPFTDRDLGVKAEITDDAITGARMLVASSEPELVPQNPDLVRIVNYWQRWTITPKDNSMVHLTVEGFADPAGDIPAWIANMAITDTPLNMLREIRKLFQP